MMEMPRFIFLLAYQPCIRPFQQTTFYSRIGHLGPKILAISGEELCACVYITPLFRKIKKLTRCSAAIRHALLSREKFSEFLSIV
jgi:hypothetical protein